MASQRLKKKKKNVKRNQTQIKLVDHLCNIHFRPTRNLARDTNQKIPSYYLGCCD